ncbi:MAG: helix-turn-helix domain-containing protein [Endomicrobium sp.]|jgi:transcriptional regulator with XRE-family HTH domain|nr:helix-turn-helix domain-containing protein [Endomicrobium sp.]
MIKNYTAQKIKEAVKETGLTQRKFAKKIGIGESMISQWLASSKNPTLTTLKKIAKATNKPLTYFIDDAETIVNTGSNSVVGKYQNVNSDDNLANILNIKNDLILTKLDLILDKLTKKGGDV